MAWIEFQRELAEPRGQRVLACRRRILQVGDCPLLEWENGSSQRHEAQRVQGLGVQRPDSCLVKAHLSLGLGGWERGARCTVLWFAVLCGVDLRFQ